MYQIIILIIISIILGFCILLYLLENQKYKIDKESIVENESKKLYVKEYPNNSISDLERQIRIVTERFIEFKDSNRYTEKLVQTAKKDNKIRKIKALKLNRIKIINYRNKNLKAKVEFKSKNLTYYFIMKMKTVYSGRIFLKDYKIVKC